MGRSEYLMRYMFFSLFVYFYSDGFLLIIVEIYLFWVFKLKLV